MLLIFKGYIIL